jgi:hypothetical protein
VVEAPETLTPNQIVSERNVEIRRIMLERFGAGRFLQEIGSACISEELIECLDKEWCYHTDDQHRVKLHKAEFPDDEPLVMVEMVNCSPEPDGSWKTYFERVPPWVTSARQGIAWQCGFDNADDYQPVMQS